MGWQGTNVNQVLLNKKKYKKKCVSEEVARRYDQFNQAHLKSNNYAFLEGGLPAYNYLKQLVI